MKWCDIILIPFYLVSVPTVQDPCQNSRCTQEEICTPSSDFKTYTCGFPQKGVCFSGKDIDTEVSKNVKGWKDCADICAADLTCKKWTHIGRTNTCSKFKNTIVMKTSSIGCTSGVSTIKHPTMPVKQPTYGKQRVRKKITCP